MIKSSIIVLFVLIVGSVTSARFFKRQIILEDNTKLAKESGNLHIQVNKKISTRQFQAGSSFTELGVNDLDVKTVADSVVKEMSTSQPIELLEILNAHKIVIDNNKNRYRIFIKVREGPNSKPYKCNVDVIQMRWTSQIEHLVKVCDKDFDYTSSSS